MGLAISSSYSSGYILLAISSASSLAKPASSNIIRAARLRACAVLAFAITEKNHPNDRGKPNTSLGDGRGGRAPLYRDAQGFTAKLAFFMS